MQQDYDVPVKWFCAGIKYYTCVCSNQGQQDPSHTNLFGDEKSPAVAALCKMFWMNRCPAEGTPSSPPGSCVWRSGFEGQLNLFVIPPIHPYSGIFMDIPGISGPPTGEKSLYKMHHPGPYKTSQWEGLANNLEESIYSILQGTPGPPKCETCRCLLPKSPEQ